MSANIELIEGNGAGSYISQRDKEREEIINALRKRANIRYFSNFIIIDGKTYNGWNKSFIDNLKESIKYQEKK